MVGNAGIAASSILFLYFLGNVVFYMSIFNTFPKSIHKRDVLQRAKDMMNPSPDIRNCQYGTFDYIIVGGGAAGCLLANRLSKHPKNRVLLLERGGYPDPLTNIPAFFFLVHEPPITYNYVTVPQENACLEKNGICNALRGKGLGGSGNVNFMVYKRGSSLIYDEWANITDDNTWKWNNVLKAYKNIEDYDPNQGSIDRRFHSKGGEVRVSKNTYNPASLENTIAAFLEKHGHIGDINTGFINAPIGDIPDMFIKNGKRWGPFQSFLRPVLHRKNLIVVRYAQVIKVNMNSKRKAIGVTYIRHKKTFKVKARKEVILSAGTYDTPKILMLSGIGPKGHLKSLGIPVRVNLPVGQNLQDHPGVIIDRLEFNQSYVSFVPQRDLTPYSFLKYIKTRKGPLSSQLSILTGYLSSYSNPNPIVPDFDFYIRVTYSSGNPIFDRSVLGNYSYKQIALDVKPDSHSIDLFLVTPESRGQVTLSSRDPLDDPLIDTKPLSASSDLKRLVQSTKAIVDLYDANAFKRLNATLKIEIPSMCEHLPFKSNGFWECYIRARTILQWHPCCTCPMGKKGDPTKVVDSRLRVFGVKNLRVVDASIMPNIVNCNLQAPIYAIAQKAAKFILGKKLLLYYKNT